ncbi:TetR/AcrR family transcriptional regulator [Nocardiopsis sediminis]|uniref:TetR/AcrR family transcriptional regulator n=1 Tax=Nocardiopsis sediminis TaxID=1778267 RepID=A0ABV8FNI1_9ACTN
MHQLIEHRSRKAARILDSARELVLDHGVRKVTVSEIARTAGVGKGTVYLYWATKEDLILGLFARELLAFVDAVIDRITADPAAVLPRRLAPLLISTGRDLALKSRLSGGGEVVRLLTQEPGDRDLFARIRPRELCDAVMPILHRHGLLHPDRPLADQSYVMHAVLTGFGIAGSDPGTDPLGVDDPDALLSDTVARLIEPPAVPDASAIGAAAAETAAVFRGTRDAVLDLIARSQVTGD